MQAFVVTDRFYEAAVHELGKAFGYYDAWSSYGRDDDLLNAQAHALNAQALLKRSLYPRRKRAEVASVRRLLALVQPVLESRYRIR